MIRKKKLIILLSIIAILALGTAVFLYLLITPEPIAEIQKTTDCDINGDGLVDERENRRCFEDDILGIDSTDKIERIEKEGTIDLRLPSDGADGGTLAVRLYIPDNPRYDQSAPVIIWVPGGYEMKGIDHGLPPNTDDVIVATFIFPGATDEWSGFSSDGEYDWRGENCIRALADVILFVAGELEDSEGNTIDDLSPIPVIHNNIGAIGSSNGGNLPVAAAALYGDEFDQYLRYIIQWETPVSSQVANRDFGRVWVKEGGPKNDYFNLRYAGYGDLEFIGDYSDLTYDPTQEYSPIFHDGNGDGVYTTTPDYYGTHVSGPDVNGDGILSLDEDFPLDGYQGGEDGQIWFFSRPATQAMFDNDIFAGYGWPDDIATPAEADAYWDVRESVYMYDDALDNIPNLEAMVLANVVDHVQTNPEKPHIRQAFEGWLDHGVSWVQLNPNPEYVIEAYPGARKLGNDLPDNVPNKAPRDWADINTYAIPEELEAAAYQLGAVYQMMDRAQNK
ncbi:MAG: hypothetical protein ABIH67_02655 [Candidatus Uhrbacteria bacterium]